MDHAVAANEVGVNNKTLVAATEDKVTFDRDCSTVEVVGDGTAAIYFTTDGSAPVAGANNSYELLAGGIMARQEEVRTAGDTVVRLISAGTPKYNVTGSFR